MGIPNLFLPCNKKLYPPLRNDRFVKAFKIVPGEISIISEIPTGMSIGRVAASSFVPIESIIDFTAGGEGVQLKAHEIAEPFDFDSITERNFPTYDPNK
jgi:hypothetical protein